MKYLIVLTSLLFFSCSSINNKAKSNEKSEKISMIQLISNPEKYHKKRIRIEGYFYIEREGNAIYVSKSDFENLIFKNGIYLNISTEFLKSQEIEQPYKGYVSIEGIFNKDKLGTYNFYSGTIEDVISITRLYKRGSEEFNIN